MFQICAKRKHISAPTKIVQYFLKTFIRSKKTDFPDHVDVVVIGGGSAGCYSLYHLAKHGARAILLERSRITSGTTWHTNGLMWRIRANDVDIQLLNRTRETVLDIKQNSEYDPGWIENGGLFIARTPERLNEYLRLDSMAEYFNIEHSMLSADETVELFPLLRRETIIGALHSPCDGMIDPTSLCNALVKLAKETGNAQIQEHCSAHRILTTSNARGKQMICGVETSKGLIKTSCVVNATGVWGRDLLKAYDISLPLIPMKHSYIVTDSIEGMKGKPNVRDHDASIVFRIQGSSVYLGGYEKNPAILDHVRNDFSFELYDFDWSTYEKHIERAKELCAAFGTVGIKQTICGPESFTPDHKPIIGPDSRLLGLFHNCGYNSAGMMFGGGCAEQLAKWIINDRPELDMFSFDIGRFSVEQLSNLKWATERSHEAYAENYSIIYKNGQPLAGRNFKLDALHDSMISNGAIMEDCQGFERPSYFYDTEAPVQPYDWKGNYGHALQKNNGYLRVQEGDMTYDFSEHHQRIGDEVLQSHIGATIINLSSNCKLLITGPEAKSAMNWICVGDLNRPQNSVVHTYTLNGLGGVEGNLTVTILKSGQGTIIDPEFKSDAYYVTSDGKFSQHTFSHIEKLLAESGFNASAEDVTDLIGILFIQGPRSHKIISELFGKEATGRLVDTTMVSSYNDIRVRLTTSNILGLPAFELHVGMNECSMLYNAIVRIGAKYGLKNSGHRAMRSMYCEKGIYQWGYDIQSNDTAIESNLDIFCRTNGLYNGSSIIDQQRIAGVSKKLISFTIDVKIPIWGLECIYRNGNIVGYVRRGDFGYKINKSIGTAYICRDYDCPIGDSYLNIGAYHIKLFGKMYPIQLRFN